MRRVHVQVLREGQWLSFFNSITEETARKLDTGRILSGYDGVRIVYLDDPNNDDFFNHDINSPQGL